jgi:hypothetical protein
MILLDRLKQYRGTADQLKRMLPATTIALRVHEDVVQLADELATRDQAKLLASAHLMFMPAVDCWFEWPMGEGDMGLLFLSGQDVRRGGGVFYAWRHKGEEDPIGVPLEVDLKRGRILPDYEIAAASGMWRDPVLFGQQVATLQPVILAFLALINSPGIVKRDPARLDRLNRKRAATGRYTYHPHHVVRLNVDRKAIRVGASDGGDGASRCLHFVRAHLRLWKGSYILVSPHWRGDPSLGMRKTSYEVDRQTSRWRD